MSIDIKHRTTGAVLFHSETATTTKEAVTEAVKARADLRGADLDGASLRDASLRGADLRGADLDGANLRGADLDGADLDDASLRDASLRGANLRGADLDGANLRGANLDGANLDGASLRGADLDGANLGGANLRGADLDGADLDGANLRGASLRDAYLRGANLGGADLGDVKGIDEKTLAKLVAEPRPTVPKIAGIHQRLLAAVTAKGCRLDMGSWHSCETTHCRAGWVVTLAGEEGMALEKRFGPATAARMIYRESDPDFGTANFYASNEKAMADIRACAEREAAKATP